MAVFFVAAEARMDVVGEEFVAVVTRSFVVVSAHGCLFRCGRSAYGCCGRGEEEGGRVEEGREGERVQRSVFVNGVVCVCVSLSLFLFLSLYLSACFE